MFAKHLPPGGPRVMALDGTAAAELPAEIELISRAQLRADDHIDAVVGYAPPDELAAWLGRLRPGGRLILAYAAPPEELLAALTSAGYIHCLVEPHGAVMLYRGERPPLGSPVERLHASAGLQSVGASPFIFLLIHQTPNKPAWKLAPDEKIEWQAVTVIDSAAGQPALLAFSSLVKAVAFMQSAVQANFIVGVNKVGKFRADVSQRWPWLCLLNPEFEAVRGWALGPRYAVEPQLAVTGAE